MPYRDGRTGVRESVARKFRRGGCPCQAGNETRAYPQRQYYRQAGFSTPVMDLAEEVLLEVGEGGERCAQLDAYHGETCEGLKHGREVQPKSREPSRFGAR